MWTCIGKMLKKVIGRKRILLKTCYFFWFTGKLTQSGLRQVSKLVYSKMQHAHLSVKVSTSFSYSIGVPGEKGNQDCTSLRGQWLQQLEWWTASHSASLVSGGGEWKKEREREIWMENVWVAGNTLMHRILMLFSIWPKSFIHYMTLGQLKSVYINFNNWSMRMFKSNSLVTFFHFSLICQPLNLRF